MSYWKMLNNKYDNRFKKYEDEKTNKIYIIDTKNHNYKVIQFDLIWKDLLEYNNFNSYKPINIVDFINLEIERYILDHKIFLVVN